jgi:sucrose-phosphate synthase
MVNKGLYIQMYSIHGLIRGHDLELGKDADTGGQTKYVLELGETLSSYPEVERVELVTRLIKDKSVSSDYSKPIEVINDKFKIVRIKCGGGKYIRKELLWPHLEEFIDHSIYYLSSVERLPDLFHSHYADAGYVCGELSGFFGIPFIHTGHSLGKVKLKKLLADGMIVEDIEKRYKMGHRIKVEQDIVDRANYIVTSTKQEVKEQYGEYEISNSDKFKIIPPGVDLEKFYSYNDKDQNESEVAALKKTIADKLLSFSIDLNKPLILSLCRPAKRKNISGLITAYGENKALQKKSNLAIFAGIRKDIQTMEDNEREVLTEILLLMDKYNLYGKMAIPKSHDAQLEVPELYRIAAETGGVFVNAALTEPFGLTLIESAATGIPIVSTDDGGPRDIISNCKNGLLVDVSEPKNIAIALNTILDDKKLWSELSENGIKNVRKYYTWNAHAGKYLEMLSKLLESNNGKDNTFVEIGKKLLKAHKLIITDIDHTLIGDEQALKEFVHLLQKNHNKTGFAVATGRNAQSAFNVLKENNVPLPEVFISSVGSEIHYIHNNKLTYSKGWDAYISYLWKREKILKVLSKLDFLKLQEDDRQGKFKISYYMEDGENNIEKIREALSENKLKTNIIYSKNRFLDILPYRASKGKAIRYLAFKWNISFEDILVAGDSGNDQEMLDVSLRGVVVANYSPEMESLKENKRIYFAKKEFAGGILEGIQYYNFLKNGMEGNYE